MAVLLTSFQSCCLSCLLYFTCLQGQCTLMNNINISVPYMHKKVNLSSVEKIIFVKLTHFKCCCPFKNKGACDTTAEPYK